MLFVRLAPRRLVHFDSTRYGFAANTPTGGGAGRLPDAVAADWEFHYNPQLSNLSENHR